MAIQSAQSVVGSDGQVDGGGGGGYATIEDEGTPLAQETVIDFQGAGVTATAGTGQTIVTIPGGGGGGLTMVAQIAISFTATIGQRQLLDTSPGSIIATGATSPALGDEWAVSVNVDDTTLWTVAKGATAAGIQNPATDLIVDSFTIDVGRTALHFAFDSVNYILIG